MESPGFPGRFSSAWSVDGDSNSSSSSGNTTNSYGPNWANHVDAEHLFYLIHHEDNCYSPDGSSEWQLDWNET